MWDFAAFSAMIANASGRVTHMRPEAFVLSLAGMAELDIRALWRDGIAELTDAQWDTMKAWIDNANTDLMGVNMIGSISAWCIETLPSGILLCDGSTYQKTDYPLLYDALPAAMKTSTTFDVPNLTDRFLRGGIDGDIGVTGGEDTHVLTDAELPNHRHGVYIAGDLDVEGVGVPQPNAAQLSPIATTYTAYEGDDMAHENRPAFYTVVYGIVAW